MSPLKSLVANYWTQHDRIVFLSLAQDRMRRSQVPIPNSVIDGIAEAKMRMNQQWMAIYRRNAFLAASLR